MLIKMGGGDGGAVDIADAPKITFSGSWLSWHVEFYGGVAYWEAWFLSSGTLTLEQPYTVDAWGIGGGGNTAWSSQGGVNCGGTGGTPNMSLGVELSNSVAVTIGAPASNGGVYVGGATKLGTILTCDGGVRPTSSVHTGAAGRYRFGDPDKAGEAGKDVSSKETGGSKSAGGWIPIALDQNKGSAGQGFGGGGGYYGYATQGALVIRIAV